MRQLTYWAMFAAALVFLPSEALALGADVGCADDDEACAPMELTPRADGAWGVAVAGADASAPEIFGKRNRGRSFRWWKRFFWRRFVRRPGPGVGDPIDPAPTPDPVPEPGTMGLLALGGAFVANRVRKRTRQV